MIYSRYRLIEHVDASATGDRHGDCQSLLLPARQGQGMTIRELRKSGTVEKSLHVDPAEVIGSQTESFIARLSGSASPSASRK